MKTRSLIPTPLFALGLALSTTAGGATFDDRNWFHDYGGPASEAFQVVDAGNYLYVCGGFGGVQSGHGGAGGKNLARFNKITETWEPVPGVDGDHSNFIRCMWPDAEGNLWVGGDFSSIGGVSCGRVAKFDTRAGTWSALIDSSTATDPRGPSSGGVYAICRSGDHVYIGGFVFNHADTAMRFMRRYNVKTGRWGAVGAGLDGAVRSLSVDASGKVYAGGAFTASGATAIDHLAMWDGRRWTEVGGGVDGTVRDIEFGEDGKLYIGGDFTHVDGQLAGMVACRDGNTWNLMGGGLAGGGTSNGIWGLAVDSAGRCYVGGDFDSLRVTGASMNKVACYDAGTWRDLGGGVTSSSSQIINGVEAVGEDIYITGLYGLPGEGNAKRNFSRFNPNIDFRGYEQGLNHPIETVRIGGVLWVGTRFNSNSLVTYTIQLRLPEGGWADLQSARGFGDSPLWWSFDNFTSLGESLLFRMRATR